LIQQLKEPLNWQTFQELLRLSTKRRKLSKLS